MEDEGGFVETQRQRKMGKRNKVKGREKVEVEKMRGQVEEGSQRGEKG